MRNVCWNKNLFRHRDIVRKLFGSRESVASIWVDVEELLAERGLLVDHVTVWRWVQRYAPEMVSIAGKS
jgi:transposase-like protein